MACIRSALGSLMHLSTQTYCVDSRFCPGSSNAFVRRGRVNSASDIARFRPDVLGSHSPFHSSTCVLIDRFRYSRLHAGRVPSPIRYFYFRPSLLGSMAAEFFALMNDSSIPDNIREALASYDTPLFARSCNDQEELASLISHLMDASDTSSVGDQILARASIRLLFSRCRESCGLPPLDEAKVSQQPNATTSPTASSPAPNAGASWQESVLARQA